MSASVEASWALSDNCAACVVLLSIYQAKRRVYFASSQTFSFSFIVISHSIQPIAQHFHTTEAENPPPAGSRSSAPQFGGFLLKTICSQPSGGCGSCARAAGGLSCLQVPLWAWAVQKGAPGPAAMLLALARLHLLAEGWDAFVIVLLLVHILLHHIPVAPLGLSYIHLGLFPL